ncbi:ankyrin repeat domain-containing protein 28 [Coprinopsis cinerea AmutBmut pab1-1]|nr:ankyrin repeat domain-containing protein 28 [Coprinopsis cinerea AmutBmut pab1-1]
MTLAHDYFNTRNLQQFQRLLDGGLNDRKQQAGNGASAQPSTSGAKSWNKPSPLATMTPPVDVNARDWLGRTVLHLACSAVENVEYVRALLKHPNINVNVPDTESHWTPLHRALYHANLPAAQMLLQRSDIDISLKDWEGYTAFDLYNSTINGTNPDSRQLNAELFTWGANRNAALGLGDGNDRSHPDQVIIPGKGNPEDLKDNKLTERFIPISIRQIQMSKLHTAIVTSEESGNLRVCGFGSGGRLGPGQHTQFSLKPLPQFSYTITQVALGQDHTLALTKNGEVLSWGLNHFSQLGYPLELTGGKLEEPIQPTPRKIPGPLKKETVIGIAASKKASACWTLDEVFTWGTNAGQLGYDKNAQPVQVIPRKVTKFSQPVIALALSDNAMAGLLQTQQVECIWNDRHYRINFPIHAFPSEIQPFRPRQAIKDFHIAKVTCCGDLFAALSSNGEVFTFSPPTDGGDGVDGYHHKGSPFKPQRVWALRKKFSSVRDVAMGAEGSIIICTESGHTYVRIRTGKGGGKNFKFQRIPHLQRVTHVCANSTGAFGALRVDFRPKKIDIQGPSIAEDLSRVQPYRLPFPAEAVPSGHRFHPTVVDALDEAGRSKTSINVPALSLDDDNYIDEDGDDADIEKDIRTLQGFMNIIQREERKVKAAKGSLKYGGVALPHGADTLISIGTIHVPAHSVILAARSTVLDDILSKRTTATSSSISIVVTRRLPGPGNGVSNLTSLAFSGIHPLSLLIILHYLYSDEVLAIWDRRVYSSLTDHALSTLKVDVAEIKSDLRTLAATLELPHLSQVLQAPVKRPPAPSLSTDLSALFEKAQGSKQRRSLPCSPDVVLELRDKEVWTYSVILRARSEFFSCLLDEDTWTRKRWGQDGVLRVDLKHMRWHVMEFVLKFLLCGKDKELFDVLPFTESVDDVLEFMFDVMAAASELLLDRLILICSSVILTFLDIHNCCYILSEASYYHAYQLINSVQEYMAANMESLLEMGMLDDLPYSLVKQLSKFIKERQLEKSSFSRTDVYLDGLLAKHWDWLEGQDIPVPYVRSGKQHPSRELAKTRLSPPVPPKEVPSTPSKQLKIPTSAVQRRPSGDDLFAMDLGEPATQPSQSSTPWKVPDAPRVDMRALMAEAQESNRSIAPPISASPSRGQTPRTTSGPSTINGPGWKTPGPSTTPLTPSRSSASQGPSWRQHASPQLPPPASATPPSATPGAGPLAPKAAPPSPSPLRSKASKPTTPLAPLPGMGPTFTPTKQAVSKSSGIRNVSGGKAWTAPPPEPVVVTTNSKAVSFAAIQEAQQTQHAPVKDRRSLKEIQEEEEALQAEADFLKWWEAEENRVKEEMAALEKINQGGLTKGERGSGGGRGGRGKGRGKSEHHRPRSGNKPPATGGSGGAPADAGEGGPSRGEGETQGKGKPTKSSNPDDGQPRRHRRPPKKQAQGQQAGQVPSS